MFACVVGRYYARLDGDFVVTVNKNCRRVRVYVREEKSYCPSDQLRCNSSFMLQFSHCWNGMDRSPMHVISHLLFSMREQERARESKGEAVECLREAEQLVCLSMQLMSDSV